MKHIITFFKRSVVICLVSVILTLTLVSDYQEASKVYASSFVESGYYALRAITQAVLSSMGMSYSTTSDLDISTQGLENIISSYKDSDSFGDAATLTVLFDITAGKDIGDKISLTNPVVSFVKNYLTNQMAGNSSYDSSIDSSTSVSSSIVHKTLSETLVRSCFNNMRFGFNDTVTYGVYKPIYSNGLFALKKNTVSVGSSYTYFYPEESVSSNGSNVLINIDGTLYSYNKVSGSKTSFYYNTCTRSTDDQTYWCPKKLIADSSSSSGYSIAYDGSVSSISVSDIDLCYINCPIYDSFKSYQVLGNNSTLYSIKSRIVGDTSVSKQMTDTLTVTDDSSTKKVEDAITTATADGSTLTDADLDAIASKIIDAQNTNTGEITDSVDGSTSILEKIQDVLVTSIVAPIVSIETFVKTISNSLTTWFPKTVSAINDWAETFPTDVLEYARVGIESFPKVIDAINDISIPFPDVMSISIPDVITKALSNILAAIQGIFVVDTVAVATASENLTDIWNQHLPFIPKLKNLFNNISFSDSYDYPVLKMGTPQVIRPYYDNDYIILLDFEDYAYYLLWGRRIVRAMLWVGFAYSIIKQFKVHFHIG